MQKTAIKKFLLQNGLKRLNLQAVLFDMDGVLFDSMPIHAYSWTNALAALNIPFEEEEAYLHEGRTGSGTINLVFQRCYGRDALPEEIEQIYAEKTRLFEQHPEAPIMPGASEMLELVKKSGLKRVLVTGSGQRSLLDKLNLHFPGHFRPDNMVTAFDVKKGKPDPEPYLMGIRKAEAQADGCIVVENAPLGVESAKAAGIFTIAVNTGKLQDQHLIDAGADLVYSSMSELQASWRSLLGVLRSTQLD